MSDDRIKFTQAETVGQLAQIRALFLEYAATLGFDLCFQNFERELAELPGAYAPPRGRLILLTVDREAAGCVALRELSADICEMKRLYVRPSFRTEGLGRKLTEYLIDEARHTGYQRMRLDTVPTMKRAIALYQWLGFEKIAPYRDNPIAGAMYLELTLNRTTRDGSADDSPDHHPGQNK